LQQKKLEPYPRHNQVYRFVDRFIYVAGMLGPIMTIPQVAAIWISKQAAGVSALS